MQINKTFEAYYTRYYYPLLIYVIIDLLIISKSN